MPTCGQVYRECHRHARTRWLFLVYVFRMGRHEAGRAPANDPLMTVVVAMLLLLLALVCALAGA